MKLYTFPLGKLCTYNFQAGAMKHLMPLTRLTALLASYSFSIWASWTWVNATFLRLPAEDSIPLHYSLVLLLMLLPFFAANLYLMMLSSFHGEIISKLFPWFQPIYDRVRAFIENHFPRLAKNLFWDTKPLLLI